MIPSRVHARLVILSGYLDLCVTDPINRSSSEDNPSPTSIILNDGVPFPRSETLGRKLHWRLVIREPVHEFLSRKVGTSVKRDENHINILLFGSLGVLKLIPEDGFPYVCLFRGLLDDYPLSLPVRRTTRADEYKYKC